LQIICPGYGFPVSAIRDTVCGVRIPNAAETLWWCSDVRLDNVSAAGDYYAMGSSDIKVNNLELKGNYSFDGCRNVEIPTLKSIQ
jgi:hypothetical protein